MLRQRGGRCSQRGAAALVALWMIALIFFCGIALAANAGISLATSRAQAAADAAAHAVMTKIAADDRRESLSLEAQQDHTGCDIENAGDGPTPDPDDGDDASAANSLCADVVKLAQTIAARNGNAIVTSLDVFPDTAGYTSAGGATRLKVILTVQLDGPFANFYPFCSARDPQNRGGFCFVDASSAAQEAG